MSDPHSAFWEWSLRHYASDGVAENLIKLQDDFGLNVNILLWCGWCATRYDEIPDLVLRKAIDLTERWRRDVTGALRSSRRALAAPPPQVDEAAALALLEQIKSAELDAEKIEQTMLDRLAGENLAPHTGGDIRQCARRNTVRYVTLADCARSPRFSTMLLDAVIDRIFDQPPTDDGAEKTKA